MPKHLNDIAKMVANQELRLARARRKQFEMDLRQKLADSNYEALINYVGIVAVRKVLLSLFLLIVTIVGFCCIDGVMKTWKIQDQDTICERIATQAQRSADCGTGVIKPLVLTVTPKPSPTGTSK